jgi:hypothetical protein
MANINKSFNFRNGVQVDYDNFIVNPNGLVGIGTSIPREFLDVYGTAKITGLVTTTNLCVTGFSTFTEVRLGTDIKMSSNSGIITATAFYGNGGTLTNLPTSQWVDVNPSIYSVTSIYSAGNVGVATTNPGYIFQVGGNPNTQSGVGFNSTGDIKATGIITAGYFSGNGASLTALNATNITSGTISNTYLPVFNNDRLPSSISVSGIITASTYFSGNITGNLTGNVYSSGVSTFVSGIVGDVTGTASTAQSLTGTPNITVGSVSASNINVSGILTAITSLYVGSTGNTISILNSGRIGIGTALPTSEFQIIKSSATLLEVLSDTSQARISIGQSVGVGKSTATLRFGNTSKTFDIINNDTGNINTILHAGPAGINTGRFDWYYGQNISSPLMSLTYDGKLGLGITNPINTFHVVGTSTITSSSYVGDTLYVKNDIYLDNLRANIVASNTYVTSGVSTFSTLYLYGGSNVLGIGTNNAGGYKFKIEDNLDAYLGTKAKLGTETNGETIYFASNPSPAGSLLKVFGELYARNLYVGSGSSSILKVGTGITASSGIVTAVNGFSSGIGTAVQITTVGNRVYFTVAGVGVTSLQLF